MTSLRDIFSEENVLAYSEVCLDLAVDIPESRLGGHCKSLDTLLIPSRGAVPFFLGMTYGLDRLSSSFGGTHEEFYKNLGTQGMLSRLFPEGIKIDGDVNEKGMRVILMPFTADLNIPKFNPSLDNDEFTEKTRYYWAKVTRAFFKDPSVRSKDPYFRSFTDFILRDIEGRDELAEAYESFPRINGFSMLDTVISGRASNHIIGAFEGLSVRDENPCLSPSAFLIVDENGRKLRPDYSRYLQRKRLEGQVKMYEIPRIVSEDEGASLLGVAAVVYPTVMDISRGFETSEGEEFFVGAGGWYNSADLSGSYFRNFKSFMGVVYKGIDFLYATRYQGAEGNAERDAFTEAREYFLDDGERSRILAKTSEDVTALGPSSNYEYGNSYETSSHVLHAPFSEKSREKVKHALMSLPGIRPKKLTPLI